MPSTSAASSSERVRAALGLLGACLLWGLSFPLGKAVFEHALARQPGQSSWSIAALTLSARFTLSALLLFALRPTRITRSELEQGAGLGLFTAAGLLLQMDGLNFTAASTSAFLTQGYIVFVPLVTLACERRRPAPRLLISVAMVVAGLAVVSGFDVDSFRLGRGEAETLAAAGFFAAQILWLGRPVYRGNRAGAFSGVMFGVIGALLAPVAVTGCRPGDLASVLGSAPALAILAVLVLACTLAAFWLMNHFQPLLSPGEAGVIYGAEPVFASLFALMVPGLLSSSLGINYPNEGVTSRLVVGGGLVTLANLLLYGAAERRTASVVRTRA